MSVARPAGPGFPEPGSSTARPAIVDYRVGKLAATGLVAGRWLDLGCADGGYTEALMDAGASEVVGADPAADRIDDARRRRRRPGVSFLVAPGERLPLEDASFDGTLLNEVLEHVDDEMATLGEVRRVLRPGGCLVVFSPNRFFPFEGHGLRFGPDHGIGHPVPLVPWLPSRLTRRFMCARNYWPRELAGIVRRAGFEVEHLSTAFPQFDVYPWLPARVIPAYRRAVRTLEHTPGVRWVGVSCFIVGRAGEASRMG